MVEDRRSIIAMIVSDGRRRDDMGTNSSANRDVDDFEETRGEFLFNWLRTKRNIK